MDDLYEYYEICCDAAKSARNHVVMADTPNYIRQWARPAAVYWANQKRLWISHQVEYLDMRDDYNDSPCLLY